MTDKVNPYYHFFNTAEAFDKYTLSVGEVGLWESEKKLISHVAKKNAKILDVGCGAGRTTFGLYESGYKNITGIDVSEKLLSWASSHNAEKNYEINFYCCDAEEMPFDDSSFDFVLFSYNGLTGVPTSERRFRILKEIRRVMADDGYFVFCAHDRDNGNTVFWKHEKERWDTGKQDFRLYEFGDRLIPINDNGDCEFLHYYSKSELNAFVHRAGFSVEASYNRDEIATESENVLHFSADTRFWVLKKNKRKDIL